MPANRPHPQGNSRYTGNENPYERITRSKSNAMKPRINTRELSIHEVDEEDEEWLFRRRLQVQREGNGNNNNNNNIIINGNAVNNNESQHRNNNSRSDIVENSNRSTNEVLQHEVAIQQPPERVVNDQNNGARPIRQDPVRHTSRESYDTTYKSYSSSYTNFRTEPVRTRSTTRAEAQKRLEPITEREEDEEVRFNPIQRGDVRTSTPIKENIKTSSPTKKSRTVTFNSFDTILPYSPIGAPNTLKETGAIPKRRENLAEEKETSPDATKQEKPVVKQLTLKDLYIPPFKKNEKNQADVSYRSDTHEVPGRRRSICSDRDIDALLDQDTRSARHNLSLTSRSMAAKTEIKGDRFVIKFPQYKRD